MKQQKGLILDMIQKMITNSERIFVGDFETTVYDGQTKTEVWAAACVELYTEDVAIFHSIFDLFDYLIKIDGNVIIYFHNLKFDGSFWVDFLLSDLKLRQAFQYDEAIHKDGRFALDWNMENDTFKYSISEKGQWYSIKIKENDRFIEIRDSLKLIPLSVKRIGKSFNTKHKKLDIEYTGYRYAGCEITKEEKQYISNDVLVVKEALEIMFNEGHTGLTIGSCCLNEFKELKGRYAWGQDFPDMKRIELDKEKYGSSNADEYIRKSYRGGWCYLVKGKEDKIYHNGTTADVNSLYPSVMSGESGNYYPIGKPYFWSGDYCPCKRKQVENGEVYFFIRVKTRFYLKEGKLPFLQIKGSYLYPGNESLETSDVWDPKSKRYVQFLRNKLGELIETRPTLTLTCTDYYLLQDHYNLVDFEILDGCQFECEKGGFDKYIDKYKAIKLTSKDGVREIAKLYLNNLYGKLATSPNSSFKYCFRKTIRSGRFHKHSRGKEKSCLYPSGFSCNVIC